MIEDREQFIERFRYKNTKAVQVQSRIKQLDKLERIEVDEEDISAIKIKFPPSPRSGTIVIEAEKLSKSYDNLLVLDSINFIIERGEKVAFAGRNGEGKTTFSRIIAGDLDHTGLLKRGHNLKIGYWAQNQDELMDESLTVLQTIDNVATGEIRSNIRNILGAFLFGGDDIDKKVRVLSGGERSRLALIKLLLEPYNLLVLDEPTNHLDMRSKEILKQALVNYDGTLIVVSHDRDFLDGLVGKVYEFRNNKIKENIGGIYYFLHKKKIENLRDIEKRQKELNKKDPKGLSSSKKQYLEKKEHEKKLRKSRRLLNEIENEIERIERSKLMMEKAMSSPGSPELMEKSKFYSDYENLKGALEDKMKEWENISDNIDELEDYLPE